MSSAGRPRSRASSTTVCGTLWQRPTVRTRLAHAIAQQFIAIGLADLRSLRVSSELRHRLVLEEGRARR
jgi:hypothetical protein